MPHVRRLLYIGSGTHYGHDIFKGIDAYCRVHGQWEYHMEDDKNPTFAKRTKAAIRHWKADGIVALIQYAHVAQLVKETGLPAVSATEWRDAEMPLIVSDHIAVGRMAARHFLDNGFRHFAFSAKTSAIGTVKRCEGFTSELAKAGYDCQVLTDRIDGERETDWEGNLRRAEQCLRSLPKPVALMCMYDLRGQVISMACRRLKLRIPDDVAIIGVGNDEMICKTSNPHLSSVDIDIPRIGYEAARILDRLIRGCKPPTQPIRIPPQRIVVRQSSDLVAVEDADVAAAIRYIRDHAGKPLGVKDLLKEIPISRKALERRFERLIGRTPKAEIIRVRMELAKTLLSETELPILAVAERSGFGGREVFSNFFRGRTGRTPKEYRRQHRTG